MRRVVYDYMAWSWCAVGIVWLIAALATKRTARHEAVGSRVLHIVIMAAAIVLFVSSLPFGARLPMACSMPAAIAAVCP